MEKKTYQRANYAWMFVVALLLKISEEYAPDRSGIWWAVAALIPAGYYCFAVWREDACIKALEEKPVGRQLQRAKEIRIMKWIAPLMPVSILIFLYRMFFA